VASLEPIEPRKVLMLPKPALMTGGGASFVYVPGPKEDGQGLVATVRPVTVGSEFNEGFEVISGLKEGDTVIVEGLMSQGARLRPGAPIAIVPVEGETPTPAAGPANPGAEASPGPAEAPGAGVD
jgi:multidrug efflux pump subunit AcrA (membrane-fusion protein)